MTSFVVKPKPKRAPPAARLSPESQVIYQTLLQQGLELDVDPVLQEQWMANLQTFADTGDLSILDDAFDYVRPVVGIDEFMYGKAYLGLDRNEVFPSVEQACRDLDSGKYIEAVLKGALGTGKSTLANIMLARAIYKISCMRSPQETFGVQKRSSLVFTIQSVRLSTAKKAVFEEFGRFISNSPYFRDTYPYDKKVQSQMIFRQHNVSILPVSSNSTGAISMNVLGGVLDEMNFMQKIEHSKSSDAETDGTFDQAKRLYNALARRRRSRFTKQGKVPGILFLISSSRFPDDFTEEKAKESTMGGGTDPSIFVYSHSQWSAKHRSNFLPEEFKVLIGNEHTRSKILKEGEIEPPGCSIISVPADFKSEFEKDVDGSIRDFAGVTTLATKPFILKRNSIYDCMEAAENAGYKNIFNMEEIDLSLGIPKPNVDLIRYDVDRPRVCHIDLGLRKDACGIAVGHIAGIKTSQEPGQPPVTLPLIGIDFVLRVVPPPNDEIDFSSIRLLLYKLVDEYNLPIRWVTMDGFQSIDSRQILRKKGFKTDYQSVEKIEPYRSLRDTIYDTRLLLPKNNFVARELAELEQIVKNNKEKVDHRPNGSKDCADAVCGVTSFLLLRRDIWGMERHLKKEGITLFGDADTVAKITKKDITSTDLIEYSDRYGGMRRRDFKRKAILRK